MHGAMIKMHIGIYLKLLFNPYNVVTCLLIVSAVHSSVRLYLRNVYRNFCVSIMLDIMQKSNKK